ncbi:PqqD family protein [Actinoplanes sp. NPDC049316]|uniref:PqqD family protein n=1 Tax=Actinoplanes sp. NPDC049316 TaxID=3154727 RepID=UPI00342C587B
MSRPLLPTPQPLTPRSAPRRSPLPRPTLVPGLRRIWRDARTVQLGTHPNRAFLLDLPDPSAAALLDLLDGSRPERSILRHAGALGISPDEALALLDALHEAGLLLPAPTLYPAALDDDTRRRLAGEAAALALRPTPRLPATSPPPPLTARSAPASPNARPRTPSATSSAASPTTGPCTPPAAPPGAGPMTPAGVLRRRRAARVVVTGRGRLAAGIAVALAEAGIGHVHADVPGTVTHHDRPGSPLRDTDLGHPRAEAIAAAIRRAAPTTETRPVRRGGASLVIQLEYDQPVALLAAGYAQRRQPYLPVAIREAVPIIGPLVPAPGVPCLNCLDLHRRDREAQTALGHNPRVAESPQPFPDPAPAASRLPTAGPPAAGPPPAASPPPSASPPPATRPWSADGPAVAGGQALSVGPATPGSPVTAGPIPWAHQAGSAEPCAVATLLAATGYAVGEVLAFVDGDPPTTLGAEIEISSPGGIRRRSWTSHPACFCTPRRSPVRTSRAGPPVQGGRSAFSRSQ